jgi:hypothetical protein
MPLPLTLRLMNGTAATLRRAGLRLLPMDPDTLCRKAAAATRLQDFGDPSFRDGLDRLCASLEQEAQLTALGRLIARDEILRLLQNRLRCVDLLKRHPEIEDQAVEAPVFILGMPRTGTTSTHELMALDPQFRVPLSWEVARPFPPPERASYHKDPRIAAVDAELAKVDQLLPGFKDMHPMGAQLPQECVGLFCHDFASMQFDVEFRVPGYQAWLERNELPGLYDNHRRWLQILQWRCPGQPWVLKTPQHLWYLESLLRAYPDARIVMLHRDPLKVTVSIASLISHLRGLASNRVEMGEIARQYAESMHRALTTATAVRDRARLPSDRIIDIQFPDFIADPVAAVGRIYDHFGLQRSADTEDAMRAFIDAGRETDRHGRHSYRFADTGLDAGQERERFADYQRHYDIENEAL